MKITATYEDTIENMTFFATSQGWSEDSEMTIEDFLTDWGTKMLSEQISVPAKRAIEEAKRLETIEAVNALKAKVESNLEVVTE